MKKYLSLTIVCAFLAMSCVSQQQPEKAKEPAAAETGISLDAALADIVSYYVGNLPAKTKIALVNFEAEAPLLSDYVFEELWIHFEDSRSFVLIDRQNLELIQKELEYQHSGMVSDESRQLIGHQFGAQTLVYGSITPIGNEYRLIVRATDVEKAVSSMRAATVKTDRRFTALLENKADSKANAKAGESMANVLYSGLDNPWRFTVQTDKANGDYHDGEYMTMRIYSEKDAWFKVTHIDVNGNAQVIYPVSPNDNNFIKAGQTRQIPDNTRFKMTAPYGEEIILVGAYEKPFAMQPGLTGPLSNNLLVRSMTAEREGTREEMRPVATAKFTYSIGP